MVIFILGTPLDRFFRLKRIPVSVMKTAENVKIFLIGETHHMHALSFKSVLHVVKYVLRKKRPYSPQKGDTFNSWNSSDKSRNVNNRSPDFTLTFR